jgi:hypothetical protein
MFSSSHHSPQSLRQLVKKLEESGPAGSSWADLVETQQSVQWDWPGWLPRGFLVIVAGEPGTGKSALCLRLAASYGHRLPWPDGSKFSGHDDRRGKILWCDSENSLALNLGRLLSWGLDPAQIVTPLENPRENFDFNDHFHIVKLAYQARSPAVRLIVFDSLTGFHRRTVNPRDTRTIVSLLAYIARGTGKPVLLTHHLRKRTSADRNGRITPERLLGSSVIAQVARVIWALDVPNPAEPNNRRLMVIKNNLGPFPEPLGMTIGDDGLHFGPPPQEVLPPRAASPGSEFNRAAALLQELLANGPLPANHVIAQARAAGLSEPTLKRAKRWLGIKSNKLPGEWQWELPLTSPHQSA